MDIFFLSIIILAGLAIFNLMVGVSNDAVNFLNSSIGSRVAPRHIIMIVASLGILAGVTFSSGMMEVARKGIFHPKFFLMPELIAIFLAVILSNVLLLDLFNTFGLPTSSTVSIVFALLGAAVAVSLIKIYSAGDDFASLVNYINTGKAFMIVMGILLSVVIAFFFGAVAQFLTRLVFTFDYERKLNRYGGIWGGAALSMITYFILIKGAKGASFLTPEVLAWIKTHTFTIMSLSFLFFAFIFQLLKIFTKINILKPIVLVGTFALAMAFAGNDLVNFIGVPIAGMHAYQAAFEASNPLTATMEALQKPFQTNTLLLLLAGAIMVATLWFSKKSRTVTETEIGLGRQDEGLEHFGSSAISRIIVRIFSFILSSVRSLLPARVKNKFSSRLDPSEYKTTSPVDGIPPAFDLLRASVNLIVASAVISFATSLKLPLSTTYVTFMVAMGTSLSDQAWGRESAVYRVTGVITVIGGWFFTAFAAFTASFILAIIIFYLKFFAIIGLLILSAFLAFTNYRYHHKRAKEREAIEAFSLKATIDSDLAIQTSFEQTGSFLKSISDNLNTFFEAASSEDLERLRKSRNEAEKIHKRSSIIVSNVFETLSLLNKEDIASTQKYSHTMRALQSIAVNHSEMISNSCDHFRNYHAGFTDDQKEELRHIRIFLTRLLWNTSIMLARRKRVDYDYVSNQCEKLSDLVEGYDKNQIRRIQNVETKTRLSILFYRLLESSLRISEQTKDLLDIFKESFDLKVENNK